MSGIIYHPSRPNSQAGYPASNPSNSSTSTVDVYDFSYGTRDPIDDLSDSTSASTSELGHSEQGHSSSDHSFYDSPSILQNPPHHLTIPGQKPTFEHHEGFSSAFGLMSLDDPNVLAGIASDGTPFFSNVDSNPESGSIALPQHVRDDLMMGLKQLPTKLDESSPHGLNGTMEGEPTPRDTETRELRDFWKQYLRTPWSGPNNASTNGFPLVTPTPYNFHGHGQLEEPPNKLSPTKKLPRISSMPSVKTPPLHSDNGPMGNSSVHSHHNLTSNEMARSAQPSRPGTYIHTQMPQDDLKCYEQAVLARKTPTLSLVPRRRRPTTANTIDSSGGGRFSSPSTTSPSPVAPHSGLNGRTTSLSDPVAGSRPSSATSNESDGGSATRPSFKRLPSTTLGPANTKRALLSISGNDWSSSPESVGDRLSTGSDAHRAAGMFGGLISEQNSAIANLQVPSVVTREKHRRLSAPVAVHNLK
jgi:hypothetical protein